MAVPPLSYLFSGRSIWNKLFLYQVYLTQNNSFNESGYYSIYKSDRYGFNNPDYVWDKNEIDLVIIGDSFAHGACK